MGIYLGIDVGTTAVKVLAVDARGEVLALASREYGLQTPQPGWVQQEAEDWWRLVAECVREVTAARPEPVAALAASTQGDTVVPVDAGGGALAPAITWMDTRALPQVAAMEAEQELWWRTTGCRPAPFATAASLLWWREELPEVFAGATRFSLVGDFLTSRLTGRALLDAPNASRTLLYDISTRDWSEPLLARVGVGRERLPQAAESGTLVGPVLPVVAAELGLSPDTQVVLGGHDQTCAAVGCGVIEPGALLLSCGTAWVVLAAVAQPLWSEQPGIHAYCHAVPGGYASLGAFAGGNLLRWFRDSLWHDGECGDAAYEAITAEARAAEQAGRPPLLFLEHFYGAAGPVPCQRARGGWAGLTLSHTRGDMALSLLRGVALQAAWCVRSLARQGAPTHEVRMIGGGARSPFWTQLVADALGQPVALPAVTEAAAYGAALLAATATGAFASLQEATATVRIRETVQPRGPAEPAQFDRLEELMVALTPLWEQWP